jgi:hypothetical protein
MIQQQDIELIDKDAKRRNVTLVPGCGVEPGLTDMLAASAEARNIVREHDALLHEAKGEGQRICRTTEKGRRICVWRLVTTRIRQSGIF